MSQLMSQKIKEDTTTGVFRLFSTEALRKSLFSTKLFIKFTGYAFSTVLCKRNLLPNDCFYERNIEGKILHALDDNSSNSTAIMLRKWFDGISDAISKNYLSKLSILVYEDTNLTKAIEKYCFSYKYAGYDIKSLNKTVEEECSTLHNSIINSFEQLTKTIATLKMLPKKTTTAITLEFNSNAPDDYVAPHFETTTVGDCGDWGGESTLNQKYGEIITPYHKLLFYSKFKAAYLDNHCDVDMDIVTETSVEVIECICKIATKFSTLFVCKYCQKNSHNCCYGRDEKTILTDKICFSCYKTYPNERNCTDLVLATLDELTRKFIINVRKCIYLCKIKTEFSLADVNDLHYFHPDDVEKLIKYGLHINLIHSLKSTNVYKVNKEEFNRIYNNWFYDKLNNFNEKRKFFKDVYEHSIKIETFKKTLKRKSDFKDNLKLKKRFINQFDNTKNQ